MLILHILVCLEMDTCTRKLKKVSEQERSLICKKYDDGKGPSCIAAELEISLKTVTSIINLYKSTGRIQVKSNRLPRTRKIDATGQTLIETLIANDVSITLLQLKKQLLQQLNIEVSTTSINKALRNLHYTFKKVQLVPQRRNADSNVENRFEYCSNYLLFDESNIIFLDEFGISCSTRQKYGRSLVNTKPLKQVRTIRSKNISVLAAMNKKGIICLKIAYTSFTQKSFDAFVEEMLQVCAVRNDAKIIMDNCSIHKDKVLQMIIANTGRELIFLPPYSPQLNPIEELFSKWKCLIKNSNCNTTEELYTAIKSTVYSITENDCVGYFKHVRQFAVTGIRKEEF